MALVVTARSAVEAQPGLRPTAEPVTRRHRLAAVLPRLAVTSAVVYGLALVADSAARLLLPLDWLEPTALAIMALAIGLALVTCVVAWVAARDTTGLLLGVTLAPVLIAARAVTSELLVSLDLSTLADVADLGLGLLALGCLVWAATLAVTRPGTPASVRPVDAALFRRVVEVTAFVIFGVGLSGATVRAVGAGWACQGVFPDCNGLGWLPFGRDPVADVQLYHRLLAYVALALVAWVAIEAFRTQRATPRVGRAGLVLFGSVVAQGAVGAASVSIDNPPVLQLLHTVGAALSWSAAVVLMVVSHRATALVTRASVAAPLRLAPAERPRIGTFSAYVQLTKPRVMSLLLVTTATAMVIAARGMPPLGLFLATLIGGALMSGGAGAINHYVDRDIDPLMGRTAWRPIPSGVIAPRHALWFGIALAVLASAVLIAFVNVLACLLSLVGLLGYVFIYTLWLKRSTPSNIVIGGAAGAIPPLVGWAAVTNEVSSLTAWYLFAIIFFWTPPHFWALSLLIREHYARAGVPMLPVVRGEDETRRQIVLYSVLLVVLTLVLSPFGLMGPIYFGAAVVLGGLFMVQAVRLWREATRHAARRLYLYSILYLFALFAAMAVDRVVSSSSVGGQDNPMVLDAKALTWAAKNNIDTPKLKAARVPIYGKWYFPEIPAGVALLNLETGEQQVFPERMVAGEVIYVPSADLIRAKLAPEGFSVMAVPAVVEEETTALSPLAPEPLLAMARPPGMRLGSELDLVPVEEQQPLMAQDAAALAGIHMPSPSIAPFIFAIGFCLALVGLITSVVILIVGLAWILAGAIVWIRLGMLEAQAVAAHNGGGEPG